MPTLNNAIQSEYINGTNEKLDSFFSILKLIQLIKNVLLIYT